MDELLINTRFVWPYSGQQVYVCGSFTRWVETVPMTWESVPDAPNGGCFTAVIPLGPGYHQFKFIVDGEWKHDETQAFLPDPMGNLNNWIFLRRPESAAGAGASPQSHPPEGGVDWQGDASMDDASAGVAGDAMGHTAGASTAPSVPGADTPADAAAAAAVTRRKAAEFLQSHTAYELIPESGKVVMLDSSLPVRQALHAMHEQGVSSAPVWDSTEGRVTGAVSAGDFIGVLHKLRSAAASNNGHVTEAEMDELSIAAWRAEAAAEGVPPPPLVAVRPDDTLTAVVRALLESGVSAVPVLGGTPNEGPLLLHSATLRGIFTTLTRSFRASPSALPLLGAPLGTVRERIGCWVNGGGSGAVAGRGEGSGAEGTLGAALPVIGMETALPSALALLQRWEAVPVVDAGGRLLDVYARSDIVALAHNCAYAQLVSQWESVTLRQALSLAHQAAQANLPAVGVAPGAPPQQQAQAPARAFMCTQRDTLRSVLERLALPGVRRLVVVDGATRRVEGLISASDLASLIF